MAETEKSSEHWFTKNVRWILLLVAVVIGYSIFVGSPLKLLEIPGVFKAEFAPAEKIADLSVEERSSRQTELEARLADLEQQLAQKGGQAQPATDQYARDLDEMDKALSAQPAVSIPNIAGQWQGQSGEYYILYQQGNAVVVQQITPPWGVTLVGEGNINGATVSFAYTTALGTNGQSQLTLAPDGRRMDGQFRDLVTGVAGPVVLWR